MVRLLRRVSRRCLMNRVTPDLGRVDEREEEKKNTSRKKRKKTTTVSGREIIWGEKRGRSRASLLRINLPSYPRFTPHEFLLRCNFSTLTNRQPMVSFLRSHAFGYGSQNKNSASTRIELSHLPTIISYYIILYYIIVVVRRRKPRPGQ